MLLNVLVLFKLVKRSLFSHFNTMTWQVFGKGCILPGICLLQQTHHYEQVITTPFFVLWFYSCMSSVQYFIELKFHHQQNIIELLVSNNLIISLIKSKYNIAISCPIYAHSFNMKLSLLVKRKVPNKHCDCYPGYIYVC